MKRGLLRLALVLMGTLVGIFLAELTARSIAPHKSSDLLFQSPDSSPIGLYVLDEQTRLRPAALFQAQVQSLDYTVDLRTNELGLRGPAVETISEEHWIALGDSFTMSVQVGEQQTFAHLLGQSRQAQVWNAGVDGFSTWQSTRRLQQILEHLPIETVVLTFFTGNDFQDNERFVAMSQHPLPGKSGDPIPRQPIDFWTSLLLRHSHLYAHYRIWSKQRSVQTGQDHTRQNWQDELKIFNSTGKARLQQLQQQSKRALQELHQQTKAQGIRLIVAIAPPAFVIDQSRLAPTFSLVNLPADKALIDAPQQSVLKLLHQLNIPACDLTPALRTAEQEAPTYLTFDGHWTQHGHRAVAKQLAVCLDDIQ